MIPTSRSAWRTLGVATRTLAMFTLVLGVAYPLVVTGIGQLIMPAQAGGSQLTNASGQVVGSQLIGQSFASADGAPLPQYFQPRPSAAGDGYDAGASGGTNLGPESDLLVDAIAERKAHIAEFNGVAESAVPPDAVTASSSGLDPHISEDYANLQVKRVAVERGLSSEQVRELVVQYTEKPDLGFIGESVVNVVQLNLALDDVAAPHRNTPSNPEE